jgi:hypothetical protein
MREGGRVRIVILYVLWCRPFACGSSETRAETEEGQEGGREGGFHGYWQGGRKDGREGRRVIVQKMKDANERRR